MSPKRRAELICRLEAIFVIGPVRKAGGTCGAPHGRILGHPLSRHGTPNMNIERAKGERTALQGTGISAGLQARLDCRAGMATTTAGVANGFVQGNLAILPERYASAFHRFCQLNPKPCPIIGMSDVGDFRIPALGLDLDIRTDVPRYRVWRDG